MKILFLLLLLCLWLPAPAQQAWQVQSAKVSFKIKNAGFYVEGSFSDLEAKLLFAPDALKDSRMEASVPVGTINTGNKSRDKHLRSDDYFDAVRYPTIRMQSKRFAKKENTFVGTFDLQLKEVRKEVQIPFTWTPQGNFYLLKGSFKINRMHYGVGGSSLILGNEVLVFIELLLQEKS
jgi:polyisoprenoid-binding protein YceI